MKSLKFFALVALAVFCLAPSVTAQVMGKRPGLERAQPGPKPEVGAGLAGADRVEVTAFSVTPAQPKQGEEVTVKMKIRNKSGEALAKVPWRLAKNDVKLGEGEQEDVGAGEEFEVEATYTAEPGEHHFYGDADPDNALKESKSARQNNSKAADASVAQLRASTAGGGEGQVKLETQVLDYQKAKVAGAKFAHNVEGINTCTLGQFNPTPGYEETPAEAMSDMSILFYAHCSYLGGKASPEGFKDFTLKNGWKVKAVEITEKYLSDDKHANWQWVKRPDKGSDSPYMKMRLVSESVQHLRVFVKVIIEGPAGTDPYN